MQELWFLCMTPLQMYEVSLKYLYVLSSYTAEMK